MKKSDAVKKIVTMINHHDGGSIEPYVADKLLDYLVDELGMLPPSYSACIINKLPKDRGECDIFAWEPENE